MGTHGQLTSQGGKEAIGAAFIDWHVTHTPRAEVTQTPAWKLLRSDTWQSKSFQAYKGKTVAFIELDGSLWFSATFYRLVTGCDMQSTSKMNGQTIGGAIFQLVANEDMSRLFHTVLLDGRPTAGSSAGGMATDRFLTADALLSLWGGPEPHETEDQAAVLHGLIDG